MVMPVLNWRELHELVADLRSQLGLDSGAASRWHVDRVVIPARPNAPNGYLKSEWAIRLTSRKQEYLLFASVRPRAPYLTLLKERGPNAALGSTQSPFGLALAKHLKGARLLDLETPPRERVVILWFTSEGSEKERVGLALQLIPSLPEALLIRSGSGSAAGPYAVLARSKGNTDLAEGSWTVPDGSKAPPSPEVRPELTKTDAFLRMIEGALDQEAFEARLRAAIRVAKDSLKQARDRARQSETAMAEASREPEWRRFGDLLKATLPNPPELILDKPTSGHRLLPDFESDAEGAVLKVPCDPKLSPTAQVEKFYQMSKRRTRRLEEAGLRLESARAAEKKFSGELVKMETALAASTIDWKGLDGWEKRLGTGAAPASALGTGKGTGKDKRPSKFRWLGKTFTSKEGLAIWVGRSRDENLELTFKHARGNDVWMHVRGRPGAHTLIPLPGGKSASLDTLLDAAALTVYYSGGEKWGKTEVDYTFKKYVKRIKDSTEASYTNNKTLIVEPDAARLKRLLDSQS